MNVFLTGANGLVGSFILKEILSLGYKPKLLLRQNSDTLLIKDQLPFCDVEFGDVLDPVLLNKSINGSDAVIHCAGLVSFDPKKRNEIFKINVEGTANVVNASIQNGVKKIVHISSIAALSRQGNSLQISENSKWEDSSYNSSYAKSKYLAEQEVFRGGEEGLDFTIINPTVVIGPGDVAKSSTKLIQYIRKNTWFFPNGYINTVDVRDVARVSCAMLTIEHQNRLLLNSGVVSYRQLYETVCRGTNLPFFSIQLPKISLYLVALWSILKSFFIKSEPLLTLENCKHISIQYDYKSMYYNQFFNTPFISLEESIHYTLSRLDEVNSKKGESLNT